MFQQIATGFATAVGYTIAANTINTACNNTWEKTINPVIAQIPASEHIPEMVKNTAKSMTKRTVTKNILNGFVPFVASGLTQYANNFGLTNAVSVAASTIGISPVLLGGVAVAGVAGIAAGAAITYVCCKSRKVDEYRNFSAEIKKLKKNRTNKQPKRLKCKKK